MPEKEGGFTPVLVLLVATIALILFVSGVYIYQATQTNPNPSPTVIPISSIQPVATPKPIQSPIATTNASPTPNPTSASPLTLIDVTQPDCDSSSCGSTTVLTLTGSGFRSQTQLSATGQTSGNPYVGILTQVNSDGTEIIFDLLNLPCQTYTATITSPMPAGSSATFTFYPKKC